MAHYSVRDYREVFEAHVRTTESLLNAAEKVYDLKYQLECARKVLDNEKALYVERLAKVVYVREWLVHSGPEEIRDTL